MYVGKETKHFTFIVFPSGYVVRVVQKRFTVTLVPNLKSLASMNYCRL